MMAGLAVHGIDYFPPKLHGAKRNLYVEIAIATNATA